MDTPICDFVRRYAGEKALRLHMPGHKGLTLLGPEELDITEIEGADSLYEAGGIIRRSEENAGQLFGARSFYSAEGSSLCIRAMLFLIRLHNPGIARVRIAAGRNAHKSFLSACALLDLDVDWLYPREGEGHLSCALEPEDIEKALNNSEDICAVYLTSPDYLGNTLDIAAISAVCRRRGVPLLVDNAHGAYLKFLPSSRHPIDLGADMCCDSAHKTLPALTGGAYLHISHTAAAIFADRAKEALAMFGSTSPSYLILQSLDAVNAYLADGYREKLAHYIREKDAFKARLEQRGYVLCGDEPLKLTIAAKSYGYRGTYLAELLREKGIVCEFADPDYLVLMLTPENGSEALARLENALGAIPIKEAIPGKIPVVKAQEKVMSIRDAAFAARETIAASKSAGRVLAAATVSCPPAVPIVVCGERIGEDAVRSFEYYGIKECIVVK